ncbi:MAG TPA: carboxylating nicotinate-nucleotide diphosphorylase [Gemmatimonadaceae bacterium]|nr:carboxylating nicotinate-nucleotide diphosphorylase [Gemmatimonadaceae bacterium]
MSAGLAPERAAVPLPLAPDALDALVRAALEEDRAFDDVTTRATVDPSARASARMVARAAGVVAGLPLAAAAFSQLDRTARARALVSDGAHVARGDAVMEIDGPARAILSAERVALNFVQRLSGIATLTARYVDAVRGTRACILDTRKTTPGLRALEKWAVRLGGGESHRPDLAAAVLIKDNHIAAVGGDVVVAVRRARELAPATALVEVECDTVAQVEAALGAAPDIILLDNMSLDDMRRCVALVAGRVQLEASGGISLETARAIAETGVDRISVGALTHSAPALDVGLDFAAESS